MVNDKEASPVRMNEKETVPGIYAQYTFNLDHRLTAMAGIRADHSSVYGTFVTPRLHLKYMPTDILTLRLSAGKGYRTPHALAENNYLLASGRRLVIDDLEQEEAWNYGASAALNIPLLGETLKLNAEYYYTRFTAQAVTDYEGYQKEVRQMEKKVAADSLAYHLSYRKYEEGMLSTFDIHEAAQTYLESSITLLQLRMLLAIRQKLVRYYINNEPLWTLN